jgi:hypothetical protein
VAGAYQVTFTSNLVVESGSVLYSALMWSSEISSITRRERASFRRQKDYCKEITVVMLLLLLEELLKRMVSILFHV